MLLVRAHVAPLFFFQQCSPVGIAIFAGEDPQSELMKRDESNRVYWFQTIFLSLVYEGCFYHKGPAFTHDTLRPTNQQSTVSQSYAGSMV